jgi:Sec-independent protein translocase protein TatA
MKKKKLLSLKIALDNKIKGITWGNVHLLGKNNLRQIVKDLREAMRETKKQSIELMQPYKRTVQYTPEYKEMRLQKVLIECMLQHRQEVIDQLIVISKKLPNMPQLPCFDTALSFGEAFYKYDWGNEVWEEDFYFNLYSSKHLHERWISLAELRLLQQQKHNMRFLSLWKKAAKYDPRVLLEITIPTEEELLEKRIAVVTTCLKQPAFCEVKDNLATLIQQDKQRLATKNLVK